MTTTPNLSGIARAGYVVAGIILSAWGIWGASVGWAQIVWLVIGGALIVEGAIGFCTVSWFFGKKAKPANRVPG